MSIITQSARGASAYTHSDYSRFQSFDGFFSARNDSEQAADAWSAIIDELLRIRNLEDDWDGDGTIARHSALVDGAIKLAMNLKAQGMPAPDRVHACINPTVYFEWQTSLAYTEIEVISPVTAEYRTLRNDSGNTEVQHLDFRN